MRKVGVLFAVLFAIGLLIPGGMALVSAVGAADGKKLMAGDQIIQGGDVAGCSCPKTSGPCVYDHTGARDAHLAVTCPPS